MIEQVNGAGLSGMTEKSAKHGKNSLFSKLLSMLEKHVELSGKGKGLQLHAATGKGKVLGGLIEKMNPLMEAKSKHLLALAQSGISAKKGENEDEDDSAVSLIATHVVIAQTKHEKKSVQFGNSTVLIAGRMDAQADHKPADQWVVGKGSNKADQSNQLLQRMTQSLAAKEGNVLDAMHKPQQGKQAQVFVSEPALLVANKVGVQSSVDVLQKNNLLEQLAKGGQLASPVEAELGAIQQRGSMAKPDREALSRAVIMEQNPLAQSNHVLGKKSDAKVSAEAMSLAAGVSQKHNKSVQQNKSAQSQQGQHSTISTLMSAAQISVSDASSGDSSSQFSDSKGSQDNRAMPSTIADVRSSSATTHTNFQSYLTGKSAPSMTLFDSMNHIAQSAKNGKTKLEIQLDPANLGKIHISLQTDAAKQLQVHMIVDQSMTRAALEQQLPQLRSALAQQGFNLSGFSMDSQGQQSSSGGDGKGQGSKQFSNQAEISMADSQPIQQQRIITSSGLSIRV